MRESSTWKLFGYQERCYLKNGQHKVKPKKAEEEKDNKAVLGVDENSP